MKCLVWTNPNYQHSGHSFKCIFNGEISHIPTPGMYIQCRDGFACEIVQEVAYNLVTDTIEVIITDDDSRNEYGDSLY